MMKKALLAAAALAVSGLACAQQSPSFYVAANAGVTSADVDCSGTTACDKRDTGWRLLGGVKFTPNVAVEVQAHNYGEITATVPGIPPAKMELTGYGAGVALSAPLGENSEGFVRLGVASNKAKVSFPGFAGSADETKTKPYYGLGVAYRFNPNVALRVEIEGTNYEIFDESGRATLVSAGLAFTF